MKSDIVKYDALLTEHITKSSINMVEAIEKEHARFVQKIASDSNAIIAEISEAVSGEFATQTYLIEDSVKRLDDKLFKQACIVFIAVICALFACSILSSTWAANKAIGNAKVFKVLTRDNSIPLINLQKINQCIFVRLKALNFMKFLNEYHLRNIKNF